jgi:hypothetical protein
MIEREATEHGAVVIDLMAGANLTKTLFATEELALTNLSVVNPTNVWPGPRTRGSAWRENCVDVEGRRPVCF